MTDGRGVRGGRGRTFTNEPSTVKCCFCQLHCAFLPVWEARYVFTVHALGAHSRPVSRDQTHTSILPTATTDWNTRALPTRGHARPRLHLADRRITNLCAHRSLCYSTRARWIHVGTPAHVCSVYGRLVLNLRARAGRYTTIGLSSRH